MTSIMPSSSSHQAKRPYAGSHSQNQSSITSYFTNSASRSASASSATTVFYSSESRSPLSPPLPALVQSNLLSVGMRIRKSVPEGYKTGANLGASTVFTDITRAVRHIPQARTYGGEGARRELTPFCGIMKVGGMAVQSWGQEYNEVEPEDVPDLDDLPFLSSQGSTISIVSVESAAETVTGNKRRFSEEDEQPDIVPNSSADGQSYGDKIWQDSDVPLSPKSRPVDLGTRLGSRSLAMPKSRRRRRDFGINTKKNLIMDGQENMVDADFEEAEFLDYGLWKEDSREVIMRDA